MNLINGLCAKNGTERANICKLDLFLQPRFIARFNQLVTLTSQTWESSKPKFPSEEVEDKVDPLPEEGTGEMIVDGDTHEEEYGEYDGDEEELPGTEEVEQGEEQNHVQFQVPAENVQEAPGDGLTVAEEDEVYGENDELYDLDLQSTEAVMNDDDDVAEVDESDQQNDFAGYEEQVEEDHPEEPVNTTDLEKHLVPTLNGMSLEK